MSTLSRNLDQVAGWIAGADVEPDDASVAVVLTALNATIHEIGRQRNLGRKQVQADRSLVTAWQAAALAIRRTDADLARRLQMKAEYWADPNNWTQYDIERADISIARIGPTIRNLLKE